MAEDTKNVLVRTSIQQRRQLHFAAKAKGKSLNQFCLEALEIAAKRALNQDPLYFGTECPMKIKRFLQTGELPDPPPDDISGLYSDLGDLLDGSEASELFGSIVFEGEDGKFYVATVEGCVGECSPEYLQQVRAEVGEQETP